MQKYLLTFIIGMIGLAMLLPGCAKRVKSEAPTADVQEEVSMPTVKSPGDAGVSQRSTSPTGTGMGLADIYFDFDKFNIRSDMQASMKANAKWMMSNSNVTVMVEGHADDRGTDEYNLALGERRAQTAKRFLIASGVDSTQISTISYGEERSVCTDHHENCYSKNRRAHFAARSR